MLDQTLVNLIDLEAQLRLAHWNSKGPHFIGLHKLYDDILDSVQGFIDETAERMGSLGGIPNSRATHISETTELSPFPEDTFRDTEVLEIIITRCGEVSNNIREAITVSSDIEDDVTTDLFTQIAADLDKQLYLLQSHRSV